MVRGRNRSRRARLLWRHGPVSTLALLPLLAIVVMVHAGIESAHAAGADHNSNDDAVDFQNDAILAMPEHPKTGQPAQPKHQAKQTPCATPGPCETPHEGAAKNGR